MQKSGKGSYIKKRGFQIILLLASFLLALASGLYLERKGILYVGKAWSIGIFAGPSPFELGSSGTIHNPVLTAGDVTDVRAEFVADPFLVIDGSQYYMFFEVLNRETRRGNIGLASSADGVTWHYEKIILHESFHLSYPYVFRWNGEYYLVPESNRDSSIRLYRAIKFPTEWRFERVLLSGYDYCDPSIFRYKDKWWMFSSSRSCDILRLYHADDLMGPWVEHPKSPLVEKNPHIARPGGRVLVDGDKVYRFAQDDKPYYGIQVYAFEITELTETSYAERPVAEHPILGPSGKGWNAAGMHTLDAHRLSDGSWIASVDGSGWRVALRW